MPFHTSLITAGAGSSIPITGGAATSGDAFSGDVRFGAVNIGGLFGSPASSTGGGLLIPIALAGAAALAAIWIFRRR